MNSDLNIFKISICSDVIKIIRNISNLVPSGRSLLNFNSNFLKLPISAFVFYMEALRLKSPKPNHCFENISILVLGRTLYYFRYLSYREFGIHTDRD